MLQLTPIRENSFYLVTNTFTNIKSIVLTVPTKDFNKYFIGIGAFDKDERQLNNEHLSILTSNVQGIANNFKFFWDHIQSSLEDDEFSFYNLIDSEFDELTVDNKADITVYLTNYFETQIALLTSDYNEFMNNLSYGKKMNLLVDYDFDILSTLNNSLNAYLKYMPRTQPKLGLNANHIYKNYVENIVERMDIFKQYLEKIKYGNYNSELYKILLSYIRNVFVSLRHDTGLAIGSTFISSSSKLEILLNIDMSDLSKSAEVIPSVYKKDSWLTCYYHGEKYITKTASIDLNIFGDKKFFQYEDEYITIMNKKKLLRVRYKDLVNISVLKTINNHPSFNNFNEVKNIYQEIYNL